MSFDMNALLKQAQEMQEQMQQMQEEAAKETADGDRRAAAWSPWSRPRAARSASCGSTRRRSTRTIRSCSPTWCSRRRTKRLRAAHAKVEAKMKSMLPPDLGGLLPGL